MIEIVKRATAGGNGIAVRCDEHSWFKFAHVSFGWDKLAIASNHGQHGGSYANQASYSNCARIGHGYVTQVRVDFRWRPATYGTENPAA